MAPRKKPPLRRAWVMVLGDVGRSPRMQYHTSSLCKTVRQELAGKGNWRARRGG